MNSARICLTEDTDPPVIVEAAIALQFLIEKQEGCELFFSVLLVLKKVAMQKKKHPLKREDFLFHELFCQWCGRAKDIKLDNFFHPLPSISQVLNS